MRQPNRLLRRNIPEEDIRRRFKRGIYNLINLYMPICDSALVYNNAHGEAVLVAKLGLSKGDIQVYEQVKKQGVACRHQ